MPPAGLLATLDGSSNASQVDLYGFNWSKKSYHKHRMSNEELIVQAVARRFPSLRINPTACDGLYHCEPLCDTGQFRTAVDEDNCQHQVPPPLLFHAMQQGNSQQAALRHRPILTGCG